MKSYKEQEQLEDRLTERCGSKLYSVAYRSLKDFVDIAKLTDPLWNRLYRPTESRVRHDLFLWVRNRSVQYDTRRAR